MSINIRGLWHALTVNSSKLQNHMHEVFETATIILPRSSLSHLIKYILFAQIGTIALSIGLVLKLYIREAQPFFESF